MHSTAQLDRVRQLLADGKLSQRKIARLTGVSRGTISALAHGKWRRYEPRPRESDTPFDPDGIPVRCNGCGGMVLMPCLACHVRKLRERGEQRRKLRRRESVFT
jgi:hypothetical protein